MRIKKRNEKVKNNNLLVAEKLLEITVEKPYPVHNNNSITLEMEDIYELSADEIVESLKRLEDREIVRFEDEEDKYDTDNLKYINLYLEKDKLIKFIEIAKDKFYKITTQYKKKLTYVFKALDSFLQFESLNKPVDFSELNNRYVDVALWIADYSGTLKIIYEDEPDVEWKGLKRPQVVGVSEVPKKFVIIDVPAIKRLKDKICQLVIEPKQKGIKLFLNKNLETKWRCAECGRFLDKLTNKKQIIDYLNNFAIHKFRKCHKCRKRNYFLISPAGEISFLLAKPKEEKILKSITF